MKHRKPLLYRSYWLIALCLLANTLAFGSSHVLYAKKATSTETVSTVPIHHQVALEDISIQVPSPELDETHFNNFSFHNYRSGQECSQLLGAKAKEYVGFSFSKPKILEAQLFPVHFFW